MIRLSAFLALAFAPAFAALVSSANASDVTSVYIGTNGAGPGTGIARARFDATTGTLSKPELAVITPDPAYLLLHPEGHTLYAANTGTPGGVSAFAIAPARGELTLRNGRPSPGRGPSHLGIDASGRFLFDANYGDGHVRVHALNVDGSLGEQTAFVQHEGHSVHPERQTRAHAHCVMTDPTNGFALVADLGLDQVVVYRFDASSGELTPSNPPFLKLPPGSGPRHLAWHSNGRWLYVVNELANTVTACRWDAARGALEPMQTVPTLPADFTASNTAAEIGVHPNGKFVYASNRGHDSIAIFAIDEASGKLSPLGHVSSRGKTPRYFAFDPTGRWMLVTNHDSDAIVTFAVDPETGALTPHGDMVSWARPHGIVLLPMP